jgi:hypothetical protein
LSVEVASDAPLRCLFYVDPRPRLARLAVDHFNHVLDATSEYLARWVVLGIAGVSDDDLTVEQHVIGVPVLVVGLFPSNQLSP